MKIVHQIVRLLTVSLLFFGVGVPFSVNADEDLLPAFKRKASRSRGLLSRVVEEPSKTENIKTNYFKLLDDVPYCVDTNNDVKPSEKENALKRETAKETEEQVELGSEKEMKDSVKQEAVGQQEEEENLPSAVLEDSDKELSSSVKQKIKPVIPTEKMKELGSQKTAEEEKKQDEVKKVAVKKEPTKEVPLSDQEEQQIEKEEEQDQEIVFNFKDASLISLVHYIESLFDVRFIINDAIQPILAGSLGVGGHVISFTTHKPLSKKQAWSLFLTFLDMAGLAVVPQSDPKIYRIVGSNKALKSPLPTYIGIDSEKLADNDSRIRYVYFVKDTPIATLQNVLNGIKSASEYIVGFEDIKALLMIGSSYNIKSLMRIVRELDRVNMPQAMSVLKLRRVDASHVKTLYDNLVKADQKTQTNTTRIFGPKKSATALYFPETARMIVEERTNSLILLGTEEDIQKIEDFVVKHIDVDIEAPYSPLHVYQLKYADAKTIANIMDKVTQFGKTVKAGKVGGVRGQDKYLKDMTFTPEETGNRIVIRGEYEDYLKAKEVIEKLDAPQPQVAVEVLILSIGLSDIKALGTQIRNKPRSADLQSDGLLKKNINFQTSGNYLSGSPSTIVESSTYTSGAKRLLGDLISLVTGASAGNTVLTLGNDAFGVWGVFNILKTITNLQIISNPFLVATNKTAASVSLGEIRNIQTSTIAGTQNVDAFSDKTANLTVTIVPQINSDGMIVLDLRVEIVAFRDDISAAAAAETAARTTKVIDTTTILADKEVLALGGLIKNKIENDLSKLPILGNIPLIGWLFKNKKKSEIKEDLLVLVSARILDPDVPTSKDEYTSGHLDDYKTTVEQMRNVHNKRDVIDRNFFAEKKGDLSRSIDKFIFRSDKKKKSKKRRKRKKKLKKRTPGLIVADTKSFKKRKRSRRKKAKLKKSRSLTDNVVVTAKVEDPAGVVVQDRGACS